MHDGHSSRWPRAPSFAINSNRLCRPRARHCLRPGVGGGGAGAPERPSDPGRSARPLPLWLHRADHQPRHAARLSERCVDHPRAGLGGDPDVHDRVAKAIAGVLANQSASGGSFGLWAPGSEDMWLDAYVTDFLTRARAEGFLPFRRSRLISPSANLKNKIAYAKSRLRTVRRPGHRLCALRAGLERPRGNRRSPLLRRGRSSRRFRYAARQGADLERRSRCSATE